MKLSGNYKTNALSAALSGGKISTPDRKDFLIGVLPGEGIGPEIIEGTLKVLEVLEKSTPYSFEIKTGGKIGFSAFEEEGKFLTEGVATFCKAIFAERGALLAGPGGGRFVYELRKHFDLFCKFTPIRPFAEVSKCKPLTPEARKDVDMVIVRENTSGAYFGEWGIIDDKAFHRYEYTKKAIARILQVGVQLASMRRNKLWVVLKTGGLPSISQLWQETLNEVVTDNKIDIKSVEIDNAVFQLIANAPALDVVVAPNMFGDILSDCAALLLGSRGMSFSGNFSCNGASVFQTAHGAAHDLARTDKANPIGQILSLAMLLRESFGLYECAEAIERAIASALREVRTEDVWIDGFRLVGTKEMAKIISGKLQTSLLEKMQ